MILSRTSRCVFSASGPGSLTHEEVILWLWQMKGNI